MSPEGSRTFEKEWPALAGRLNGFLARKGISPDQREDLVQETGARLVGMWQSVDRNRPTWALTLTIALNILRDRYRRGEPEIATEIPDIAAHYDVEQAGLARVELGRVKKALSSLTGPQRAALLAELGYREGMHRPDSSADKMMRSRARRRLNLIVGRASAGLALQFRRAGELFQALVGSGGSGLQAVGCAACAFLAFGAAAPHGTFDPAVPSQSRSDLAPFVHDLADNQASHALGGVASRALAPEGTLRNGARARRSLSGTQTAAPKQQSAPKQTGTSPVPAPLPDPPQPPPNLGRGAPKVRHPLIDRVQAVLNDVNPTKL
ncbi:MAG TPA: hypothetical protein VE174_04490 [Actinomycetota bacterium]|nr:hypothetical protein [Actinomycetota bacterium]